MATTAKRKPAIVGLLEKELRTCLALLEFKGKADDRVLGQIQGLRYVQTFLANRAPRPRKRRRVAR